jgi:transcriptional regulator with XRE-family HTH domain
MSLKETRKRMMADPITAARIREEVERAHRSVALADLRAGLVTQDEIAQILGVSQRRVSASEKALDLQLSTLRSYLASLGYELDLIARSASGETVSIRIDEPVDTPA